MSGEFIEEIKIIKPDKLFFIENPVELCALPYPRHKRGCPNINRVNCPPNAERLEEKYDLAKPYVLCYVKFSLKKQKEKMQRLHPEWSDRRCGCLLYWQPGIIKRLRLKCVDFVYPKNTNPLFYKSYYKYELIPEAMGLNVFATMNSCGIKLEKNPQEYVYKVAFIGVLKEHR